MAEPVEVFELVVVCCLPAAASFQSSRKGTPCRKLNYFYHVHDTPYALYERCRSVSRMANRRQCTPPAGSLTRAIYYSLSCEKRLRRNCPDFSLHAWQSDPVAKLDSPHLIRFLAVEPMLPHNRGIVKGRKVLCRLRLRSGLVFQLGGSPG
jgi:hypothetical protein